MNVTQILRDHAQHWPDEVALTDVYRGRLRSTTFLGLDQAAGRLAALLRQADLSSTDAVLVFQPMSAELYIALMAILRLGLTAMFIDSSAGRRHIERCCRLLQPRALMASSRAHLLRLTTPEVRKIPLKFSIGSRLPGAIAVEQAHRLEYDGDIYPCGPDAPALITFTSGTTAEPKLVVRTHGFLLAQHRAIAAALRHAPGQVDLTALPIFVLANLASRISSVLPDADLRRPDAIDAAPLVAQIVDGQVTRIGASPSVLERMVEFCERRDISLPAVEQIFTGGGPVSLGSLDRLQHVAPHSAVTAVYGSTEAEPICTLSLNEIEPADRIAMSAGAGQLVGRPVPAIQLRIIEDRCGARWPPMSAAEFDRHCQTVGAPGEIIVEGDHVLTGYFDNQVEDDNRIRVDSTCWHRTGDAGYLDERWRLWLLGRCSARIQDDRGSIYPLGVEQVALAHESIRRAAVISSRGQRLLVVERFSESSEVDSEALLKTLRFAQIDAVRVLKRLPVDDRHNSKTDYAALRPLLEDHP